MVSVFNAGLAQLESIHLRACELRSPWNDDRDASETGVGAFAKERTYCAEQLESSLRGVGNEFALQAQAPLALQKMNHFCATELAASLESSDGLPATSTSNVAALIRELSNLQAGAEAMAELALRCARTRRLQRSSSSASGCGRRSAKALSSLRRPRRSSVKCAPQRGGSRHCRPRQRAAASRQLRAHMARLEQRQRAADDEASVSAGGHESLLPGAGSTEPFSNIGGEVQAGQATPLAPLADDRSGSGAAGDLSAGQGESSQHRASTPGAPYSALSAFLGEGAARDAEDRLVASCGW